MIQQKVVVVPPDYALVGTCGKCGGPVIQYIVWGDGPPPQYCNDCGARVTKVIAPTYGPIMEME